MGNKTKIAILVVLIIAVIIIYRMMKSGSSELESNAFDGNIKFNGICYEVDPEYPPFSDELEWDKYTYALHEWVMPRTDANREEFQDFIAYTKGLFKGLNIEPKYSTIRQNKSIILDWWNSANKVKFYAISVGELRCNAATQSLAFTFDQNKHAGVRYIDPILN